MCTKYKTAGLVTLSVLFDYVCGPTDTDDSGYAVRDRLNALDQAFSFPRSAMAIQLCTARAGFSHCPDERGFLFTDWPMPRDERSEIRFRVYRDLRNKGYYLTSAGKFGGDFLVYPGMFIIHNLVHSRQIE